MEALKVFLLAIVQGIGEFLPISSSGHLLVLGKLLFSDTDSLEGGLMTLGILLHGGTLLSILVIFYRQIWDMLTKDWHLIGLLVIGSIPAGIIGLIVKKEFEFVEHSLLVAGLGFLMTAFLLFKVVAPSKKKAESSKNQDNQENGENQDRPEKTLRTMTCWDAFFIGLFQAITILPGCSRSGFTISAALMRKLRREDAASFSFLLAVPVIGGATLLEIKDLLQQSMGAGAEGGSGLMEGHLFLYSMGMITSFIVGLVSLIYLLKWLKAGKLHYFGYWLIILGVLVLCWAL